jgi:hypothetical protein
MLGNLARKIDENSIPITESGCWLWTGDVDKGGYGRLSYYSEGKRVFIRAHRASFLVFKGDIPAGHFICHKCDVPGCVNPDHLFAGTALENTRDMIAKGRDGYRKKEQKCTRGHDMTPDNTLSSGRCRTCSMRRSSQRYSKVRDKGNRKNIGSSGVVGVHYKRCVDRWVAHIDVNKKRVHLGTFRCALDAYSARKSAEIRYEEDRKRKYQTYE